MANMRYRARDRYGKAVSGVIEADDKAAVVRHLNAMGYVPISIEEAQKSAGMALRFSGIFGRIPIEDVTLFTRLLSTLERAGVPLLTGLMILRREIKTRSFKDIIGDISKQIEEGSSLSDALSRYPNVFTGLYVNMIRAGEASGSLDEMLERLVEFGEREIDIRARVKNATRYPMIALGALSVAFLILVNFVIPRFASVYAAVKVKLPLPTRIMLKLSFIMQHYWPAFLILTGVSVFLGIRYINTKSGRFQWDSFKLRAPIFGKVVTILVMGRFARTMGILLKSGLPMLRVLAVVSQAVGNARVSLAIDAIIADVKEGRKISEMMNSSGLFPPIIAETVAIGEDTGKLDELLMKISDFYESQADYMLKNLTVMIEPLFIFVLAIMVLVTALSVFLPMWNLVYIFKY